MQGGEVAVGTAFQLAANGLIVTGALMLHPNFAVRSDERKNDRTANSGYHIIATAGGVNDSRFYASETFSIELKKLQTGEIRLTVTRESNVVVSMAAELKPFTDPVVRKILSPPTDEERRRGCQVIDPALLRRKGTASQLSNVLGLETHEREKSSIEFNATILQSGVLPFAYSGQYA